MVLPMSPQRLAEYRELVENTEDLVNRADLQAQLDVEWWGSSGSSTDDYVSRDMWQLVLAAHGQPLADAAD
jgi:hypothetical protein